MVSWIDYYSTKYCSNVVNYLSCNVIHVNVCYYRCVTTQTFLSSKFTTKLSTKWRIMAASGWQRTWSTSGYQSFYVDYWLYSFIREAVIRQETPCCQRPIHIRPFVSICLSESCTERWRCTAWVHQMSFQMQNTAADPPPLPPEIRFLARDFITLPKAVIPERIPRLTSITEYCILYHVWFSTVLLLLGVNTCNVDTATSCID